MKNISSLFYLLWNYSTQRDKQKPDSTHSNLGTGDPMRLRSQSGNWCLVVIHSRCRSSCRGVKGRFQSLTALKWHRHPHVVGAVGVFPSVFSVLHFLVTWRQTSNFVFHTFSKFCVAQCVEEFFGLRTIMLTLAQRSTPLPTVSWLKWDPEKRSIRPRDRSDRWWVFFFWTRCRKCTGTIARHIGPLHERKWKENHLYGGRNEYLGYIWNSLSHLEWHSISLTLTSDDSVLLEKRREIALRKMHFRQDLDRLVHEILDEKDTYYWSLTKCPVFCNSHEMMTDLSWWRRLKKFRFAKRAIQVISGIKWVGWLICTLPDFFKQRDYMIQSATRIIYV